MSNNMYNANFVGLLSKYKIEIPIIQRDYVQGREENRKIRQNIISSFKEATNENPIKLDFIYGSIKNDTFYPLDGQQRLTTLFLYHLYFAFRDKEIAVSQTYQLFKKFTYSTRTSSKEFFEKLIDSEISIDNVEELSKKIVDQNWFIAYWKNDPSVSSALNMLDEIHNQCFGSELKFKDLIKLENFAITFEFLELKSAGLPDDLYITMNARGKNLSSFENIKADLIRYIKKENWESGLSYEERFSTKLDGIWIDYFWDEGKNIKKFDVFLFNFFKQFLITEISTRHDLSGSIISNYTQSSSTLISQKNISLDHILSELLVDNVDVSLQYLDKKSYDTLYKLLDQYSKVSRSLNVDFDLWIHEFNIIDNLINSDRITYPNRVYYFAHSCFLLSPTASDNLKYNKWMRVVRNIIENSTIDTIETFRGALLLIKEISEGCADIYEFMTTHQLKSKFAERQVKEEIQKGTLLCQGLLSYKDLIEIEDKKLCHGRIEFVLNYIETRANKDYSIVKSISNLFSKYFSNNDFTNAIRALFLTCGNGKFYDYWTSWVYVVDLPKRCLIVHTNDLRNYSYNQYYRKYFEEIIDKLLVNDDAEEHLQAFISSKNYLTIPKWKQEIINNYIILDTFCKSKMIAVAADDSKCYLMNTGKPRSKEKLKELV